MSKLHSRKLEFLMCGSPNDAFYSQAAMYRLFLDSFGGAYRDARLVLCLADHEVSALPSRWKPSFRNIEIQWTPLESFLDIGDGSDYVFSLLSPDADLSFVCDADTLLVRPIPKETLDQWQAHPAVGGVIAHHQPRAFDAFGHNYRALSNEAFWNKIATHVLGRAVPLENTYTLSANPQNCPFYINHGFVAGTHSLLTSLQHHLLLVQPRIREILDNQFFSQIGIAMAVEQAGLPTRVLPMRYNFPNDPIADGKHSGELGQVHVIHYLRTTVFDRHRIFATRAAFDDFLSLELSGSNAALQGFVRGLTRGEYPFGDGG